MPKTRERKKRPKERQQRRKRKLERRAVVYKRKVKMRAEVKTKKRIALSHWCRRDENAQLVKEFQGKHQRYL